MKSRSDFLVSLSDQMTFQYPHLFHQSNTLDLHGEGRKECGLQLDVQSAIYQQLALISGVRWLYTEKFFLMLVRCQFLQDHADLWQLK